MPTVDVVVDCPVHRSFRVEQMAGMFDVELANKLREEFSVELPGLDEDWQIGVIVGPSGSGKSTIARRQSTSSTTAIVHPVGPWPTGCAVAQTSSGPR